MPADDISKLTDSATDRFSVLSTMDELMTAWPGAQRALFAKYHIGGCSSCAFLPNETVAEMSRRHNVDADEVLAHLRQAAHADAAMFITPADLATSLASAWPPLLVDIRTREEHEAVTIPGSVFFTDDLQRELFASPDKSRVVVIYDHRGSRALDMAAWFIGHSLANTRALAGGIDAYSREVDPSIQRYRIEMDT